MVAELLGKYLVPENATYVLLSQKLPASLDLAAVPTKIERYFQVEYQLWPLDTGLMERLKNATVMPELHLPRPNPFVPKNLDIVVTHGDSSNKYP